MGYKVEKEEKKTGVWMCLTSGCGWQVGCKPVVESGREIVDGEYSIFEHDQEAHREAEYGGGMEVEEEWDEGVGTSESTAEVEPVPPPKQRSASFAASSSQSQEKATQPPSVGNLEVEQYPLPKKNPASFSAQTSKKKKKVTQPASNGDEANMVNVHVSRPKAQRKAELGVEMEVQEDSNQGVGTSKGVEVKLILTLRPASKEQLPKKRTASPSAQPNKKKKKTAVTPNDGDVGVKQIPFTKKRSPASSAQTSKDEKKVVQPPSDVDEADFVYVPASGPFTKPRPPLAPDRPHALTTTLRTSRAPSSVKPQVPPPVPQPASSPSCEYTAYIASFLPSVFADEAPSLTSLLFARGIKSVDKFKWYISNDEDGVQKAMRALRNDDRRDEALLACWRMAC
ncbi:hypothetical protein JCM8547_000174 [Rhodosporidiobolus lusitaniae]